MKKDEVNMPNYVFDIHKMWLVYDRNHLNQLIMKADTKARNPPIGSNRNQGVACIPMCDYVR